MPRVPAQPVQHRKECLPPPELTVSIQAGKQPSRQETAAQGVGEAERESG